VTRHFHRRTAASAALVVALQLSFFDGFFGADKVKHFFLAAFIQSVAFSSAQALGADRPDAMRASLGVAAGAAIGREIHDARAKGRFSVPDLLWGAGGMGAASAMLRHTK
jgi:hypothetical protein